MIPGILRINSRITYGRTSRNVPLYLFNPLNKELSPCIVGCSLKETTSNVLALINVERWEPSNLTRGNLIRVLGPCGNITAEEDALLFQYGGNSWKNTSVNTPTFKTHTQINGYTFNVDPAGCTDIDDVVTIGDDGYMYITIADVASWMTVNPDIFQKASTIGQTLYKRGKVVEPLLPIQEQCSLLPGKERHGIALKFKWTGTSIEEYSFEKVTLTNNETFTYDTIKESKHAPLLQSIASHLRGSQVTDPHEWIEELMILYNDKVAEILTREKNGLLRSQYAPDIEKYKYYYSLGSGLDFLSNKSAFYSHASEPVYHWGLSKLTYCHATSPIRRFADIVNQMVLSKYEIPTYTINVLNQRCIAAKKYERDMFFLGQILSSEIRTVKGITLNDHRVWVNDWKRIITCLNTDEPGTHGTLHYSLDMNQTTWKKKMVFRFEKYA